jgi:glyoxylase-like metal-dependent hydrolase (beta-lactamase superfamily II)
MHDCLTRRSFLAGSICVCCACVPLTASFAATSVASTGSFGSTGVPTLLELGIEPMIRIGHTVWVSKLAPDLWLHTTTAIITEDQSMYFPANGLILEGDHGSVLIDTGYFPEQAELLLKWSKGSLRRPITQAVATHFHRDRTGGIPALEAVGISTVAHPLTCELARSHGTPVPTASADFVGGTARLAGQCELFLPGAGHTRDNIVAWLPRQRVLFGGCLLKSVTSADLGNLADAVVDDWAGSARRVSERYPTRQLTIPGHGIIGGDPIGHTLVLLAKEPDPPPA